jgi:biotin transport system permease protein
VAANIVRVVAVILLANLVTLTTRTDDLVDAIERALAPLRHLRVNPGRVALMLSMTITTIPVIAGYAAQIREAQRARGVPVAPLAFVVPLLVMALKHADDLADALTARGVD